MDHMWQNELAPKLAAEYLSALGRRWLHVRAVGELADLLVAKGMISDDIAAAAWLHDVGYAEELASSGFHPLDGATFLAEQGAPLAIVGLVGYHTGASFEAEERGLSRIYRSIPRPDVADLDSLTLLDLVTAPDGSATDPETRIAEILSRYPQSSPVYRAVTRSRQELLASAARARHRLGLSDDWPAGVLKSMREP